MACLRTARTFVSIVVCLVAAVAAPAAAFIGFGFESAIGHNGQAIGSGIPGLIFSTTTGGSMRYADINTGYYSVTSDNGKMYEDGEYFVSGDGAAFVPNLSDRGKISFVYGPASYFAIGYSSEFSFVLEAYDSTDVMLTSVTGSANTRSQGGSGLSYLSVSHPGIAYVILHDQGGYWLVDNLTTDAPVPEPASLVALALGVLGLVAGRRR